jgi:hypothetical protein
VNPGGKLPLTFGAVENQVGFTQAEYPGLPADNPLEANYTEALLVGYRWYVVRGTPLQWLYTSLLSFRSPTGGGASATACMCCECLVGGVHVRISVLRSSTYVWAYVGYTFVCAWWVS